MDGEVIGVNTAIISPTGGSIGIGFAVPADVVAPVVQQLRQFKEMRRGWLGVKIQTVTRRDRGLARHPREQRRARCCGHARGPGGQGRRAVGDIIVKFDKEDVD